jgi:hypothetical protein
MPLPPSAPPDLRIFARAIWPQITAGIAVNSQPHVNERTAKMRLQIATGGVRGTVCATAGRGAVVFRLPSRRCNEVRWRNQDPAFVGARRIQVREREGAFTGTRGLCAPQHGKESKMPDEKLTGHFVLATSYSRTAYRRTTIGAAAFHFRVRNGNGWCHYAIVTRVRNRTGGSLLSQRASAKPSLWRLRTIEVNRHYLNFERTINSQLNHYRLIL